MATKNFNLAKLARNINIQNDGSIAFSSEVSAGTGGETIGSLTASMDSDQTTTINFTTTSTPVPIVQAYKEVPQAGISAKGQWDVNANATNYDFYDEKPISYASSTLTPSATGDGTFTLSSGVGYSLSAPSFGSSFNVGSQAGNPQEVVMKTDGTKMYILDVTTKTIFEYDLSTPFDLSTGAYNNVSYTLTGLTYPWGLIFKPDGTKMYVLDPQSTATISEYALSTAWDVSTASHTATGNYPAGPLLESYGLFFKSDGSKVYILRYDSTVYSWNLTTPWDITTGSYIGVTSAFLNSNSGRDILFNDDGLKMYLHLYDGTANSHYVREYDLSTAWDPSTASYNNISFQPGLDLGGSSTTISAMCWANSGKKLYVTKSKSSGGSNYGANSFTTTTTGFGTSETWVNGTNNNEHATIQQALTSQAFNRMNKAQLDAVADAYHFSQDSADTLDLMIAPYAASGTSPISDGVTINYDAASKYRQAVPETDYRADFVGNNKLEFTSNISANFKVKVL
jgi:hypothetical protein